LGIQRDEPAQNKVTIGADKFEVKSGVDSNIEASMFELSEFVRKAIHKECQPGGAVWCMCCR
ncbi:MAG: Fur-regulated protein, partial [Kluyvera sp.]